MSDYGDALDRDWQADKLNDKIARLERIEQAAREVLKEIQPHPDYCWIITTPVKARDALEKLRVALGEQ